MSWLNKTNILFLVILIEGYVVLASELLAIRVLVPFVGSGVEVTSIIIGCVLLPLAFGYYSGGDGFSRRWQRAKTAREVTKSVRQILVRNVIFSLVLLSVGFSSMFLEFFSLGLNKLGLDHRLIFTTLYALFFLVGPMYWLGQTVPLTSHYFSKEKLSEVTGRMLFFSTVGSFFGSIISTLLLMNLWGVHYTAFFTLALMLVLALLVAMRSRLIYVGAIALGIFLLFNCSLTYRSLGIVSNNAYNMIQVKTLNEDGDKFLLVNRSTSSLITKYPQRRSALTLFFEDELIATLEKQKKKPLDILVLGAAGFDMGRYDINNYYTFVDIDPAMQDVVEKHFINGKLGPNKKFIAASARAFLNQEKKQYDLIIVDVYTHNYSIPQEAVTKEFYQSIKEHLVTGGMMGANLVSNAAYDDLFSVRIYNTLASVFPLLIREIIPMIDPVTGNKVDATLYERRNVAYVYINSPYEEDKGIYTDDLNRSSLDGL